jgi:hypothetical protein
MNLVDRVVKMLTTPRTEWEVVAAEGTTTGQITTGYVVPMTLAAHLASFIGSVFVGAMFAAFGVHHSTPFFLVTAVVGWAVSVAVVYLQAWVVNALAPSFGSTPNPLAAFKLVVYAETAGWVGSLLLIIPALGMLGSLAGMLYSIYLFYLGVPRLMGTPPDKVIPYMLVSAVVIIGLTLAAGAVVSVVVGTVIGAGSLGLHG